ncbi:MAG: hypothetical protein EXS30_11535 [Pedosphaera sp.]|nr:hypothetical protein [Pedosphaera sp.]
MASHTRDAATLVALLVLNERTVEAERIAVEALKEWDDPQFREDLDLAKSGRVPPPRADPSG